MRIGIDARELCGRPTGVGRYLSGLLAQWAVDNRAREHEFVLYGRTQNSQAGNHLLTPLLLAGGHAILVDRGWVPLDIDEPGAPGAAPPSGDVDVEGVLLSSEGGPPGAVGTADVEGTCVPGPHRLDRTGDPAVALHLARSETHRAHSRSCANRRTARAHDA